MAKRNSRGRAGGFSLVEMLVALVFTGLLMAGMSQVFKSSLGSFYMSGEALSSARRNRMSMDLLYDDLNSASMFLTALASPPVGLSPVNPTFYVIPNQPVAGAGADDPQKADELYFFMDQPFGFEGRLTTGGNSGSVVVVGGGPAPSAADMTFVVDCGDAAYAGQIDHARNTLHQDVYMVPKDSFDTLYTTTVTAAGKVLTVIVGATPNVGITGQGSSGMPSRDKHIANGITPVLFYTASQVMKYSIKMKNLDPQVPAGIPCLVREQEAYQAGGWNDAAADLVESIITENVQDFKVYLSADSGQTWAGHGKSYAGFTNGWTNGMRADLDTQLATAGRADVKTTQGNEFWFRKNPTLVRLDITTRSAVKRQEYSGSTNQTLAAFRTITKTIVTVPRHSGLPIN